MSRESFIQTDVLERALLRADKELIGIELKGLSAQDTLFGKGLGTLDSLNLVAFIFIIEEEFIRATGKKLKISTTEIISKNECPFSTLKSLQAYLVRKDEELK